MTNEIREVRNGILYVPPYFLINLLSKNVLVHCIQFATVSKKKYSINYARGKKFSVKINYNEGWASKKYRNKTGTKTQEDYPATEKPW